MRIQSKPNPQLVLDLAYGLFHKNPKELSEYLKRVNEPEDLSELLVSAIYVVSTLTERVRKYTKSHAFTEKIWAAIIASAKPEHFGITGLNEAWLASDIEEFITEVINPLVVFDERNIFVPEETVEHGTANDELHIYATAVLVSVSAFIRGISISVQGYGTDIEITNRLVEYFRLLGGRDAEREFLFSDEEGTAN